MAAKKVDIMELRQLLGFNRHGFWCLSGVVNKNTCRFRVKIYPPAPLRGLTGGPSLNSQTVSVERLVFWSSVELFRNLVRLTGIKTKQKPTDYTKHIGVIRYF